MDRWRRSWALARSSWAVLRADRELVLLPVVSAVVTLLCVAPFVGSVLLLDPAPDAGGIEPGAGGWLLLALAYLLGAYVTIFFQAALVHAANDRLAGHEPTLRSALEGAADRAGQILPWAVLSATVSVALRAVQERAGIVGRLLVGLAGVGWALVTFLVLPIIVVEGVGVREALSRSSSAFRSTWGENVAGNAGIGLVSAVATLVGIAAVAPLVVLGFAEDLDALVVLGFVLGAAWIAVVAVVTAALGGVYRTALYRYAVLGEEPAGFGHDQVAAAFTPRQGRGALR